MSLRCLLLPLVFLFCAAADSTARQERRPNILWIVLEDQNAHYGCYGDAINEEHTPTIDAFAKAGVLFERCYMTAPVCSASRSAPITGVMQTTTGCHQHRSTRNTAQDTAPDNLRPLPDPYTTLPEMLRDAGYFTFNRGKDDYNFTYDRRALYSVGTPAKVEPPVNPWQGLRGNAACWRDRTDKAQPWFGQIQLAGGKHNLKNLPAAARLEPGAVPLPPYYLDTSAFHALWTYNWNAARASDLDLADVLAELRRDGELENTVIFFFADHGDQQHLRGKQFCYEDGVHVPLLVTGPAALIPKGARRAGIMTSLDISATTVALAGLTVPAHFEGQDLFRPDYTPREFVVSARDRCDYSIDRIRTVRSARFRYVRNFLTDRGLLQPQYRDHYPTVKELRAGHAAGTLAPLVETIFFGARPTEELYDLGEDPWQVDNLALQPEFAAELLRHRKHLDEWIERTDDQGQYPESEAEMKAQLRFWKDACVNPEYDAFR